MVLPQVPADSCCPPAESRLVRVRLHALTLPQSALMPSRPGFGGNLMRRLVSNPVRSESTTTPNEQSTTVSKIRVPITTHI